MALGATVAAVQQGGFINVTVKIGGNVVYTCQYPAALPGGMTLPQYKAMIAAEVQAMVAQIVAGQGAPAAVTGLDGQTF